MPKQKTHKGLSKRVKVTGTGKISRRRAFGGHLMSGKSGKRRQLIGQSTGMSDAYIRKTRAALAQ